MNWLGEKWLINDKAKAVIAKSNGVVKGRNEGRLSLVCTLFFITHCTQNFEDVSYNRHCCKTVNFIQTSTLNHHESVKFVRVI